MTIPLATPRPDSSDWELWRRNPCSAWLLTQLSARFDHGTNWIRARSMDELSLMRGHQAVVDWIEEEIRVKK